MSSTSSGSLYASRFAGWHLDKDPGDWPEPEDIKPMRNVDQFKVGFVKQMAEMGLLPSDFEREMTVKSAAGIGSWFKGLGGLAALGGKLGWSLGVGVPLLGGAVLGAGGHAATRADDEDLEEVKQKEMTALYRQLAQNVRERSQSVRA